MSVFIKFNIDKSLQMTKSSANYQMENLADNLVFLIPPKYEDYELGKCSILLFLLNQNENPNIVQLESQNETYNDYIVYKIPIDRNLTFKPGSIKMWLNFINSDWNLVLKSGYSYLKISEHDLSEEYLPDEDLDLLDQWQTKMDSVYKTALDSLSKTQELANLVAEMVEEAEGFTNQVSQDKGVVTQIRNEVTELKSNIDKQSDEIDKIRDHIDQQRTTVDTLSSKVEETFNEITNLHSEVKLVGEHVEAQLAEVKNIASQIDEQEINISKLSETVSANAKVAQESANNAHLYEQNAFDYRNLSEGFASSAELSKDAAAESAQVASESASEAIKNATEASKDLSEIQNLKKSIEEDVTHADSVKSEIETLYESAQDIENNISHLQQSVIDAETNVENLTQSVTKSVTIVTNLATEVRQDVEEVRECHDDITNIYDEAMTIIELIFDLDGGSPEDIHTGVIDGGELT